MQNTPLNDETLARPSMLREARAILDVASTVPSLLAARPGDAAPRADRLVIVVPGFGTGDLSTLPLRHFLRRLGHTVEGWGLGRNLAGVDLKHALEDLSERWAIEPRVDYHGEASVPFLCDRFVDRVRVRHAETDRTVSLVGWSLGGYIAREAARDLPGIVDRVVTLGAPTVGGPKYTSAAPYFRRRGMDLDWIEQEVEKRESRPIRQPVTAIYSRSDAVVSWGAAIDRYNDSVRHVEVDAAHLGLAFNAEVWRLTAAALEEALP